ncbi:hypothetical protein ABT340_41365 [Streptosporangium sp. NPDC000239]|uniref:hypothetical protein n=1 Tax=Streptosporangium sp. NPDC000239 TaxID=3154248 RepID=UPI00331A7C54
MRIFARRKGRHGLSGSYSGWSAVARQVAEEKPPRRANFRPVAARSPYPALASQEPTA